MIRSELSPFAPTLWKAAELFFYVGLYGHLHMGTLCASVSFFLPSQCPSPGFDLTPSPLTEFFRARLFNISSRTIWMGKGPPLLPVPSAPNVESAAPSAALWLQSLCDPGLAQGVVLPGLKPPAWPTSKIFAASWHCVSGLDSKLLPSVPSFFSTLFPFSWRLNKWLFFYPYWRTFETFQFPLDLDLLDPTGGPAALDFPVWIVFLCKSTVPTPVSTSRRLYLLAPLTPTTIPILHELRR